MLRTLVRCAVGTQIVGLVLLGTTGCVSMSTLLGKKQGPTLDTSLLEAQGYSIPPGGMPSPVAPSASGAPRIVLEVRDDGRHLESIPLPMDRAVFVEEIVQQAQLHDKLGRLSISIMRPSGDGGPPIRLETRTNTEGKAEDIGKNYALLPGDHLVVVHDSRTALEKFFESTLSK